MTKEKAIQFPPPAPQGYPIRYERQLALKGGQEVFLRPILPTDGPLIVDLFHRMSPQSIYLRFLRQLHAFPEDMVHRFTHVDYHSAAALVAVIEEDGKNAIIGVGRYGQDPDGDTADLGVAVRDDWQHFGLGKSLLAGIVGIAKDCGISRFTGMMASRNFVMMQTLRELGYNVTYSYQQGFFHVDIRA
jgi:acetyltransferase